MTYLILTNSLEQFEIRDLVFINVPLLGNIYWIYIILGIWLILLLIMFLALEIPLKKLILPLIINVSSVIILHSYYNVLSIEKYYGNYNFEIINYSVGVGLGVWDNAIAIAGIVGILLTYAPDDYNERRPYINIWAGYLVDNNQHFFFVVDRSDPSGYNLFNYFMTLSPRWYSTIRPIPINGIVYNGYRTGWTNGISPNSSTDWSIQLKLKPGFYTTPYILSYLPLISTHVYLIRGSIFPFGVSVHPKLVLPTDTVQLDSRTWTLFITERWDNISSQ